MSTPHAIPAGAGDTGTRADRRQACLDTLAGNYRALRFPAVLEADYRQAHAARAYELIRQMLPWVTALFGAVLVVMYVGASGAVFDTWLTNALLPMLAAIGWLWLARVSGLLARQPHLHTGLVLALLLFFATRSIFLIGDAPGTTYITYQVIYLMFVAFTVAQLRLQQALGWTLAACVLLLADAELEQLSVDWLAFSQYFVTAMLISSVIGFLIEHRARGEWLKSEIARHERDDMVALKLAAEASANRQRVLGDYLERVGGNLTPTEIAGRTLSFLVQQTGAQVGTVFLVEGRNLRRASSHALEGESTADYVERGESLIGQAASDGRRLRLTHLPDDYHPIRTATGSAPPAELLVQPVQQQGQSLAVIELGSLSAFSDGTLAVVDRICAAMAASLVAANAREALARAGMDDFAI